MRRSLSGIVVIAFSVILLGTASAQQVPFNGSFGRDLRGWTQDQVTLAWSDRDAAGSADSGSLLIANSGSKNNGRGVHMCLAGVPFPAGEDWEIGAMMHLPEGQTATGWTAVGLNWYTNSNCTGSLGLQGPRAELNDPNSGFEAVSTTFTIPSGVGSASFVVYVTKEQDDGTLMAFQDDLFVRPVSAPATATPWYTLGSAHIQGYGTSLWRTDLEIHNPTGNTVQFLIEALIRDQANPTPMQQSYTLGAHRCLKLEDVLYSEFGIAGAAALRVTPSDPTLVVTSRTFNQSTSGTFGQFLPGVPEDQAVVSGASARLIQLRHNRATDTGYRTNIGVANLSPVQIQVDVALYGSDGTLLGTVPLSLEAFENVQADKIFEDVTGGDVADGYAVLSTSTPGGAFLTYGSVIDNVTGDAMNVQPARL